MSDSKTFREAYATLQRHAQALRTQQEPDIDNLTTIVSESVEAYRVCKERIDAVERALEQSLGNSEAEGSVAATAQGAPLSASTSAELPLVPPAGKTGGFADMDDDIPF